jgi:hypothetical protein
LVYLVGSKPLPGTDGLVYLVGSKPLPGTDGLVNLVENIKGEGGWVDALSFLVRQPAVRQGLVHQLLSLSCAHR